MKEQLNERLKKQAEYIVCNDNTYEELFRSLMNDKNMYIMVYPIPNDKWKSKIVILAKPNKKDGLMNAVDVRGKFASYDDAMKNGMECCVKALYKSYRTLTREMMKPDFDEWIEDIRKDLVESGFDLS